MNFFILASCTTLSVLCKSFQRTLSLISFGFISPQLAAEFSTRKQMQRYDFLLNHQSFCAEKFKKYIHFNIHSLKTVLFLKNRLTSEVYTKLLEYLLIDIAEHYCAVNLASAELW